MNSSHSRRHHSGGERGEGAGEWRGGSERPLNATAEGVESPGRALPDKRAVPLDRDAKHKRAASSVARGVSGKRRLAIPSPGRRPPQPAGPLSSVDVSVPSVPAVEVARGVEGVPTKPCVECESLGGGGSRPAHPPRSHSGVPSAPGSGAARVRGRPRPRIQHSFVGDGMRQGRRQASACPGHPHGGVLPHRDGRAGPPRRSRTPRWRRLPDQPPSRSRASRAHFSRRVCELPAAARPARAPTPAGCRLCGSAAGGAGRLAVYPPARETSSVHWGWAGATNDTPTAAPAGGPRMAPATAAARAKRQPAATPDLRPPGWAEAGGGRARCGRFEKAARGRPARRGRLGDGGDGAQCCPNRVCCAQR